MPSRVHSKTGSELDRMRRAGSVVAQAVEEMKWIVAPGITTRELDQVAETLILRLGGLPSFKGYRGFPSTICASINEEIVHGIPGPRRLQEGDIISLDVGAIVDGYQGDVAITLGVGHIEPETECLIAATRAALLSGIAATRDGVRLSDISHAIETTAHGAGFEVVREYGGHGIGREMHEPPRISNWGPAGQGIRLRAGMTLALEPMLTSGGYETRTLADRWTVVTADGSCSAHFEHTIAVTREGAEILTRASAE